MSGDPGTEERCLEAATAGRSPPRLASLAPSVLSHRAVASLTGVTIRDIPPRQEKQARPPRSHPPGGPGATGVNRRQPAPDDVAQYRVEPVWWGRYEPAAVSRLE